MPDAQARGAVSVVIPTRDRADLLAVTLRSVLDQTRPPAHVIVADDGSTDHTRRVVEEAGARLVPNPDGGWGASAARNAGLEVVETAYVAFLDSDDLYRPRALERLQTALEAHEGAPFAYGQALAARRTPEGWAHEGVIKPLPRELSDPLGSLFARNSVPSGGALVRTEAAKAIGGYDPGIAFSEDHAFWLRLAQNGEPAYLPDVVCIHRRHGGNRGSPVVAFRAEGQIDAFADDDPRLARTLPRRRGVLVCELAIDAVHRRSPRQLGVALRELLVRPHGRLRAARSAVRQFRDRRALGRAGETLLEQDLELRDWLAGY
ncbi:MAG: glycosyltransferase family 2 protein [Thermoleophilaceae bacterium]